MNDADVPLSPLPLAFPFLSLNSPSPPFQPVPLPSPLISALETLPPELIEQIAFQLCRQTPQGPPTPLLSLLLVSRHIYNVLGPRNEGFYSDLFKERFDWKSVERRWATVRQPCVRLGGRLTGLRRAQMKTIEDKREKRALLEGVTEVRADEDLKLTYGSFTRASSPSDIPVSSSTWRPLTSKDLAIEFKRRCTVLTRLRSAGLSGVIPPNSSRPSSPRLQAMPTVGEYRSALGEPDELTQNLWTCYFMLLENGEFVFVFRQRGEGAEPVGSRRREEPGSSP